MQSSGEWSALPPERRLALAWQLFTSLEFQIQIADRKVQAIFGANTLLVAALSFYGNITFSEVMSDGLQLLEALGLLGRLLLICCACASVVFAIMALMPRVRFSPEVNGFRQAASGGSNEPRRSPLFFGDIAEMDEREFVTHFSALTPETAAEHLLVQIRQVSQVVAAKHLCSRRAATFLVASLALWIVVMVLRFFS